MRNMLSTAFALLIVMASFYALSYAMILKADQTFYQSDGHAFELRVTSYYFGGRIVETLFEPANWLDRQMRPNYWIRDEGPYVPSPGIKFKLSQESITCPVE